ncbi:murein hydrolase activator EnvC family protein [Cognatishimia activa]|uniref:Peptidase M23 n=1 Tax=Cognatishimia activa TaxID=1715691 RepID=A0A975EM02_9RHOB|nr:peptidase M23 [Cognatishimia activa]QTN34488.1 peptidase M23 [Cognatishimia activa]
MKLTALLLSLSLTASAAIAQSDAASEARDAARDLEEAAVALQQAESSRNRIKALTQVVQSYEDGLAALREGLRRAVIRQQRLEAQLVQQEAEIARLIGVLQTLGNNNSPTLFLHPQGPTGTARAGMMLADVMPALNAEAAELRDALQEVRILRELQLGAADTLQSGLDGAQAARTALSKAISDRTDPPKRFVEDPVQTALLIAATETLEGFASGLTDMSPEPEGLAPLPDISHRRGKLDLPLEAEILLYPDETDASGVTRPGITLATRANTLVSSPVAATIRYRGPLLDLDNVMVLEPQPGLLFVFAGLGAVFGEVGEVIPTGAPLGLMGGNDPKIDAILSQSGEGSGQDRTETLYIEVRDGKTPVDPSEWFNINKDR